ncbi:hypothetical protein Hanom_Chr12g01157611 [Helianthus anomalus]
MEPRISGGGGGGWGSIGQRRKKRWLGKYRAAAAAEVLGAVVVVMRPRTVTSCSPKPHILGLSHRNIIFSNRLNRIKSGLIRFRGALQVLIVFVFV